jgi:hypothetical protein
VSTSTKIVERAILSRTSIDRKSGMVEVTARRQSLQTIAWFNDLYKRGLLELDPPYQRRSVWNLKYQQFFIETLLLQYPSPAIFLYEDIKPDGAVTYSVVDGKQRLTAIFDFTQGLFPVANDSVLKRLQGTYFDHLDSTVKKNFWTYQFLVEYVPTTDESTLTSVFDRINRNVMKLTRQELRHARFSGTFAESAEDAAEILEIELPPGVPHFTPASQRQMKDVELAAQLLLLVENGPETFSQDELDQAYSDRDDDWEDEAEIRQRFAHVTFYLRELFTEPSLSMTIASVRRLRNQADFYSVFGAVLNLFAASNLPKAADAAVRLAEFMEIVQDEKNRAGSDDARRYYEAARSASNDLRQRTGRIAILSRVISSEI